MRNVSKQVNGIPMNICMRQLLLFFAFIFSFSADSFATADTCLLRTYGGPGSEYAFGVAVMPDTGFVLAGITNYYGPGGNSVYLVRTNKNGIRRWSNVLGGQMIDQGNSVIVTGDSGIYIIGYTNSYGTGGYDGLIIKTDSAGNQLWVHTYGGTDWDFFNKAYLLSDGSIVACGSTYSNGAAQADAFVVRIDQDGNVLWQSQFGGQFDDAFNDITEQNGDLFFVGYTHLTSGADKSGYVVKTDLSGNLLLEVKPSPPGNNEFKGITSYLGDLVLVGAALHPDSTHNVPWMMRIDTDGTIVWEEFFTTDRESYFNDVVQVSTNDLVYIGQNVGGGFGGKTMLMIRTDSFGNWLAGHNFGGPQDEEGYCLINVPGNKLAGCGYTTSWGFGNEDMMLCILPFDQLNMDYYYSGVYFSENLSPISVAETSINPTIVSPNPSHGIITFSGINMNLVKSISLISADGREIKEVSKTRIENGIDVSDLTAGIYFYRLATATGTYVGKFILE